VLLALNVLENIDLIKNVLVLGKPKQNSWFYSFNKYVQPAILKYNKHYFNKN
jgi:hypothetical protein